MDYCANMAPTWRQHFFPTPFQSRSQIREAAHVQACQKHNSDFWRVGVARLSLSGRPPGGDLGAPTYFFFGSWTPAAMFAGVWNGFPCSFRWFVMDLKNVC